MSKKNYIPPRLAKWLLKQCLREDDVEHRLGDFEEVFYYKAENEGRFHAKKWYLLQVLKSLPELIYDITYWRFAMFISYLKIGFRNIKKYKGYSFISISGLALGLACCIMIMVWVMDELSYDKHFQNADNIYRVTYAEEIGGKYDHYAISSFAAAPAFTDELPEVKDFTRIYDVMRTVIYNGQKFSGCHLLQTDTTFFQIFEHPFLAGSPRSALTGPGSIVMTRSFAEKIFGSEDPIGKAISFANGDDFTISGIVEDTPKNSHLKFDCVTSIIPLAKKRSQHFAHWLLIMGWSYVVLEDNVNVQAVESKMNHIAQNYAGERAQRHGTIIDFQLQKLTDIHLKSHLQAEFSLNGDIKHVYVFSLIATFTLLIALINFINLSTARSGTRSKEVGMRKVLGANKNKLVSQFLSESFLVSLLALFLAIILISIFLPEFNLIARKSFRLTDFLSQEILFGVLILMILSIFGAGSFPAFVLSKFNPAVTLKGLSAVKPKRSALRNTLVVVQFAISTLLIIGTIIVVRQLNFMKNTDPGFNREQIMVVKFRGGILDKFEVFKNELKQNTNIQEAVYSGGIPGRVPRVLTMFKEGHDAKDSHTIDVIQAGFDFLKTYDMQILAGRTFSKDFASDTSQVFLVNKTASAKLGWGIDALGKRIGFNKNYMGEIVGIVNDFHYRSLKNKINPLVIELRRDPLRYLSLKINTKNLKETIAFVEKKWHEHEKQRSFDYFFAGEFFNSLYKTEEKN